MSDGQRLQQMIDDLRRMRDQCEPKTNQNPRYHHYCRAVSALLRVVNDLAAESTPGTAPHDNAPRPGAVTSTGPANRRR